ncbi:sensor histidine kinase [Tabrizicola piscis]|uniref:histidine kinase n=1 Tax=Tabrizicola piscis TaxID=2494374 RepID=A0A3S8U9Y2_9RHOB|nr:sensor histidine kinase [Tabrizicola piscis]AZL60371.1 sensor histidine kinase [Tabrizicola piscis]
MSGYSLRRRLLLGLTLAAALIGVVALADTWREAVRTSQGLSDRVLEGSALAIAERVTVDEGGGLEADIPFAALEMLASAAEDQVFYRVDAPAGQFLTGYEALAVLDPGEAGIAFADGLFGEVPIRSATLEREISTGATSLAFTVTVAESTLARSALARQILIRSALRILVLIGCIMGIVWAAVTLAFRPLDRLGAAIAERTPDDLRPLQARVPLEAAPLAGAINSFMARLEGAVAALRHFTGNASHQLRTPLATLRTQLALARRAEGRDQAAAALDKADAALVRAERVLAQLLALARVDAAATGLSLVPVDLAALARDLTGEALPQAADAGIDLGYDGASHAWALAEPVLTAELLRNLLDNALRYAGRGAVVTVRVRDDVSAVQLEVEDDGPGLAAERLAAVQSEGQPLRMAAAPAPLGGSGLGLAIVAEIAELFGASCAFDQGAGGRGLKVSCVFQRREPR